MLASWAFGPREFFVLLFNRGTLVIHPSAHRHDVPEADITHALSHPQFVGILALEPTHRQLVLGPSSSGNPLELVVLLLEDDGALVIHAMKMRRQYLHLWREGHHG